MRRVIIIHGWEGGTHEPQLVWLKERLIKKGYDVVFEDLPNTDEPKIGSWITAISKIAGDVDENTIFVGHSIGTQATLRYMATLQKDVKVGPVILLAPWLALSQKTLEEEGPETLEIAKPWMETPIDWVTIRRKSDKFVCIFSDNDQYVPLSNAETFKKELGAEIIIVHNRFHFDPGSGVTDLPEVLDVIQKLVHV